MSDNSGDTIGPADGVSYQVVSSHEELQSTAECGFNDLGVPNNGIFMVETRDYTEYENGVLVKTWTEDVSTLSRCSD